ncbi:polysaccharide pyruvyl transferase family protein [Coraliomargarita sp. SDUM461003]|uniref:Polysaccharide pyruvyl transferase family protein n=1 Tax=Thalassobacterium maritimum TaxID=3041265 RepID=A0ABU1AYF1_9BACT|nr:polysaccharide pyruvyl transferase family protein [Coraliomargarita sp. SDUM461003]MDQ8209171.1 polysaccharide pyruvyl transferase family protein [Coraliomargarita sp. SDUM461003]
MQNKTKSSLAGQNAPTVALVNDTSLYSRHFGCQIVGQVYREQFKRVGLDLVLSLPKVFDRETFDTRLSEVDLIVVNAEGSIHHGRNFHLLELAKHYPCVLLNGVFQENPSCDALSAFHMITMRESLSCAEVKAAGVECRVVPDMIFASSLVWSFVKPEAQYRLGVTDSVVKEYRGFGPFKKKILGDIVAHQHSPGEILQKLSSFETICAGRFHAVVLAAILGIPFNAWESNTWKIKGMLEDMGMPECYHQSRAKALQNPVCGDQKKASLYARSAKLLIEGVFDDLKLIAENHSSRNASK